MSNRDFNKKIRSGKGLSKSNSPKKDDPFKSLLSSDLSNWQNAQKAIDLATQRQRDIVQKAKQLQNQKKHEAERKSIDVVYKQVQLFELLCDNFAIDKINRERYMKLKYLIKSDDENNRNLAEKILLAIDKEKLPPLDGIGEEPQ